MTTGGHDRDAPQPDTARQTVRARLRDAGLRATLQRVRILEWLDAHHGHYAAETIVERAGLPKATVYHVLGQLRDAGLVLTADAGTRGVLYESATEAHHHFVCRSCERVIDIPAASVVTPPADLVRGAAVEKVDVILRGRCRDCTDAV